MILEVLGSNPAPGTAQDAVTQVVFFLGGSSSPFFQVTPMHRWMEKRRPLFQTLFPLTLL